MDRRVARTHRLLSDALIALSAEKGYDKVTIMDITERADVAYVTFFRHYRDKEQLLNARLEAMYADLEALTHADDRASEGVRIFEYVREHAALCRLLLEQGGPTRALRHLKAIVAAHLMTTCQPLTSVSGTEVPLEVVANHVTVALFGMIEWWLQHDMPHPPAAMAQMYERLVLGVVTPRA
jgi:AcrR family transcriptional regulator